MSEVHLRRPIIDLHTHTTASDGSLRPAELEREAKRSPTTTPWTGCPRRSPPANASASR